MSRNNLQQAGMTLLEVLVAIFIIAVSASAVVRVGSQQAQALDHLQQKQLAIWLADNTLAALKENLLDVSANWQQQTWMMADRPWLVRWRRVATTDLRINALVVEVRGDKQQTKPLIRLQTYTGSDNER